MNQLELIGLLCKLMITMQLTLVALELNTFQTKLQNSLSIIINIYIIQAYDSIMCKYICIGFIDFMLKGKSLLEYTYLFSPNDYEKNDNIILKYF